MKNKKVMVTGADGFIGSHLTEELVKEGYEQIKRYVKWQGDQDLGQAKLAF